MVRETEREEERLLAGRPEKHADQDPMESEFETLDPKDKALALTEMQREIEAGEEDSVALAKGVGEVEGRDPEVERHLREGHDEGRPEGETTARRREPI